MYGTFLMAGAVAQTAATTAAAQEATRAKHQAKTVARELKVLNANLSKTLMICEALWEILRDKHGCTEDDLHKKLYEIDMRDGALDGKNQRKTSVCPNCGRTVSPRHPACIYCGQIIDNSVFAIS